MSYCRFENTANDLRDCLDNFDNHDLSESETEARLYIIEMAVEIALNHGCEIDRFLDEGRGSMTRVRTLPKPVDTIYMGFGGQWMIVTEAGAVPYRRVA